jgi:hypothetical protein
MKISLHLSDNKYKNRNLVWAIPRVFSKPVVSLILLSRSPISSKVDGSAEFNKQLIISKKE